MTFWLIAGGFILGLIIGFLMAFFYRKSLIEKQREYYQYENTVIKESKTFSQRDKLEYDEKKSIDGHSAVDDFK